MFYAIVAIILVLFYLYIAPKNIKGTLNLVLSAFLLLGIIILLVVGATRLFQAPADLWLAGGMVVLGAWSLYDIYTLDRKHSARKPRKPYRYR